MEKLRLSKLMSERGICSRREADSFIEKGWVFVDGRCVSELGYKVFPTQDVTLDERAETERGRLVTVILNKPVGFVTAQPEEGYQSAMTMIRLENRYGPDLYTGRRPGPFITKGLAPAGRLDIDSTGLVVYTQDGRVARAIVGEDSNVEKEYLVRVVGKLTDEGLSLLRHGLELDGKPLKPAGVYRQNADQYKFILTEGRKRQIRRMCELVGLRATGLKRIRIGNVELGTLPLGKWRYLKRGEKF